MEPSVPIIKPQGYPNQWNKKRNMKRPRVDTFKDTNHNLDEHNLTTFEKNLVNNALRKYSQTCYNVLKLERDIEKEDIKAQQGIFPKHMQNKINIQYVKNDKFEDNVAKLNELNRETTLKIYQLERVKKQQNVDQLVEKAGINGQNILVEAIVEHNNGVRKIKSKLNLTTCIIDDNKGKKLLEVYLLHANGCLLNAFKSIEKVQLREEKASAKEVEKKLEEMQMDTPDLIRKIIREEIAKKPKPKQTPKLKKANSTGNLNTGNNNKNQKKNTNSTNSPNTSKQNSTKKKKNKKNKKQANAKSKNQQARPQTKGRGRANSM